jgi:TolB protein
MKKQARVFTGAFVLLAAVSGFGQWTNRYPKLANVSHHVYLEGYNLPTMNVGATDPAASPDYRTLAFAARGWIWVMDMHTRDARRVTKTSAVDARPAWSPDGKQITFVRDDSRDTSLVLLDVGSSKETVLVNTPAIDLDPCFSPDGKIVYYSSAESGDLDLWQIDVATGAKKRLTNERGQEMMPQPFPDNSGLFYLAKVSGSSDTIQTLNFKDNTKKLVREEGIASNMRPALAKDGKNFAVNIPLQDRWQLWLVDLSGQLPIQIATNARYPQMPAWSADGAFVYYAEPDAAERFQIFRIRATGGEAENISPRSWNWGEPTNRVTIKTCRANSKETAARLVVISNGHPVLPETGFARFDGQNGQVYFYTPGETTVEVPAGEIKIQATQGFNSAAAATKTIVAGEKSEVTLDLPAPLWEPAKEGWYSADLHSHLNYGGPYLLTPEDIVLDMQGEKLDLATPQLANLHTRFNDVEWWNWRRTSLPQIHFAQEVRSHFLGHIAIVGADSLFFPWYNGPGYPVYSQIDLPNSNALRFARDRGGINSYVHPVSNNNPFPANGDPTGLPLELVPDALLGDVDTLEIACLWSDEIGTSEAWYRLLNLGVPIAPSAGSDTMQNLYRTMPIGSTRVYAKPEGAMNLQNFLAAVKKGRSFVTNGPLMKFSVNGKEAGEAVSGQSVDWKIEAISSVPVEKVEIIVNGKVAWSGAGLSGKQVFTGKINAPSGGWIAARIWGGAVNPPFADSYPFAHSAPMWFGKIGSFDAASAKASAQDLLRWLNVAERRMNQGYEGAEVVALRKRFADARRTLEEKVK